MEVMAVIATAIAAPIVLIPAVFVWYIAFGGALKARKVARKPAVG